LGWGIVQGEQGETKWEKKRTNVVGGKKNIGLKASREGDFLGNVKKTILE